MIGTQLFDTLLEPVFVLNEEQVVIYCNETAAIICENSVRKLIRQKSKLTDLFSFSEKIDGLDNLTAVADATPYKEVNFTTPQGAKGKVQITLQPYMAIDEKPSWIVFVRDVTLEERLQQKYRAELEQKEDFIKQLEEANHKLEDYSKNLEKMVAERTAELSRLNSLMSALLDSLDQGFFVFNESGLCLEVNSSACQKTIERMPAGQQIWDVLGLPPNKQDGFKKWMMTVFMEMLPFEDLIPLGPQEYPHSEGRNIQLSYYPLRDQNQKIEGVVVVASDITDLITAQKDAEREKAYANLILNMVQKRQEMLRFIQDSQSLLVETQDLLKKPIMSPDSQEHLFRNLHTLKGGSATFGVLPMAEEAHQAEHQLTLISQGDSSSYEELQLHVKKIDEHFQSFLVQAKTILGEKALSKERFFELPELEFKRILRALETSPRGQLLSDSLRQDYFLTPFEELLSPYKELTLRLAEKEGKEIAAIQFEGLDLRIDAQEYSYLAATLVHSFRNSVDHGLETPEERIQQGKNRGGTILVKLSSQDDLLKLTISDDGKGIDPNAIRNKLGKKGIDCSHESDTEVIQHIFDSQFSTKEVVTETSGRGVGMDAIKDAVIKMGGHVWVRSELGKGTILEISLPQKMSLTATYSQAA